MGDSSDVTIPWDATVYDTDAFWSAGSPTRLTVPAGVSKVRLKGNLNWTFGGTGSRHIWMHQNGGPFFGMGRESDEGDAGVQSIGSAVVDVSLVAGHVRFPCLVGMAHRNPVPLRSRRDGDGSR